MDSRLRRCLLRCLEHDLSFEGSRMGASYYAVFHQLWGRRP